MVIPGIASAAITGQNLESLGVKVFTDTGGIGGIKCKDQLDGSGICPIEVYTVNSSSSSANGSYQSPLPTLTVGQTSAPVLDINGAQYVHVINQTSNSAGLYASPLPTYSPGTSVQLLTDANGRLVVSPTSVPVTAVYASPVPSLVPGQVTNINTDQQGNVLVNVQAFPNATTPPYTSATPSVTGTSTVVFASNSTRRMFNICNPITIANVPNQQQIFFDLYGNSAVTSSPDLLLLPGQCWSADAVPATTSQISAIESPLPGATASAVPIVAGQQ